MQGEVKLPARTTSETVTLHLPEVGHNADGRGEEAGGMVHQPGCALLSPRAQAQAQQRLVLVH